VESSSRNCNLVYFVDNSFQSINLIRYNTRYFENTDKKYKIIKSDVLKFLKSYKGLKWDLVFLDPPYKIESDIMKKIFDALAGKDIIKKDALLIYEYFFKKDVSGEIKNFNIVKQSHFGDKKVIYLSPCQS